MLKSHPAHIRLYDMLFVGEARICAPSPSSSGAMRLEAWHAKAKPPRTDVSGMLEFSSIAELERLWAGARETGIEGLMLKRRDSPYLAGRPKGHWYKWKRAPLTLDAVLMYAQRGSGKRSSYYSDYTFGAWRLSETGELELVPVGKSYFGFTDEELRELDVFVRNHTVDAFGPVRAPGRAKARLRGGVRFRAPLHAAQIWRRHALSPHSPHPLGQARRGGGPARDAPRHDRGVVWRPLGVAPMIHPSPRGEGA